MSDKLLSMSSGNQFNKWFQPIPVLNNLSMMDHLFNRLDGAYPGKWKANFPNQSAIDNWAVSWAEEFEDEGIQPTDIKAGLKACRTKYDWPPSCAEFIKACRPSIDPVVAYYEAVNGVQAREHGEVGTWSHRAIYWAAIKIGAFDLKNQGYTSLKTRWERALNEEMSKGQWEDIPKPMISLPAPGKTNLSNEDAKNRLNDLNASGVLKPKDDELRWAKRILERLKKGDKTLLQIQIQFAREAMGANDLLTLSSLRLEK